MIRRTLIVLIFALCSNKFVYSFEIEPKQSLVLPGTQFKLKFKVPNELQYCRLIFNDSTKPGVNLSPKAQKKENIYYYGDGLDKGECGLIIDNVTDDMNGELLFQFSYPDSSDVTQASTTLIVARPPDSIDFVLMKNNQVINDNAYFEIGDEMAASCSVKNARPEAEIYLLFDGERITTDVDNVMVSGQNINTYHFRRNLTHSHNQKEVKCIVNHITKPEHSNLSKLIHVKYKPIVNEKMHQTTENALNMTLAVEANPLNYIYELWYRGKPLDKTNENVEIESITQREINNGSVSELMILLKFKKAIETKQKIFLNVTNDLGSTIYPINLYMMNAFSQEFEFGIGTYLIVILAVLIIIFATIIYARRKHFIFSDTVHNSTDLDDNIGKKKSATFHLLSNVNFAKFKSKSAIGQKLTPVAESTENDNHTVIYTKDEKPSTAVQTTTSAPPTAAGNAVVYAELDFDSASKPVLLNNPENPRTDYAEIVYNK